MFQKHACPRAKMCPSHLPKAVLVLVLLGLSLFGLVVHGSEGMFFDGYTHALFDEHFVATWCPSCQIDEPNVVKTYSDLAGSLFVVSYHLSDEFSNPSGESQAVQYQTHTLLYHVFDGGYRNEKGGIYTIDMKVPVTRPVHMIGLAIRKAIHEGILEYEGSVQEMDGKQFTGYVKVYITENKLRSEGVEWNFVFRAFGTTKRMDIGPNAFVFFSGTWAIASSVKAENILVVAAVFDNSTTGYYGPYAVQAVDDKMSGQVIPEMSEPILIAVTAFFIAFLTFGAKAHMKREFWNTG